VLHGRPARAAPFAAVVSRPRLHGSPLRVAAFFSKAKRLIFEQPRPETDRKGVSIAALVPPCACPWSRIAPTHEGPRNALNISAREPTSGRSTHYESGHLIRVFRDTGHIFSSPSRSLRVGYAVVDFCFLVALPPAPDLLLRAKHWFVEAMARAARATPQREPVGRARRRRRQGAGASGGVEFLPRPPTHGPDPPLAASTPCGEGADQRVVSVE
jgi:hypothetical protein